MPRMPAKTVSPFTLSAIAPAIRAACASRCRAVVERTVFDRHPELVGLERERHGCIGIARGLEDRAFDGRERALLALTLRGCRLQRRRMKKHGRQECNRARLVLLLAWRPLQLRHRPPLAVVAPPGAAAAGGRLLPKNGGRWGYSSAVSSARCARSCHSWPASVGCAGCRFRSPIPRRPSSGRRACSRRAWWLSSGFSDAQPA